MGCCGGGYQRDNYGSNNENGSNQEDNYKSESRGHILPIVGVSLLALIFFYFI